jgi:hypothetical protein
MVALEEEIRSFTLKISICSKEKYLYVLTGDLTNEIIHKNNA